MKGFRKFTFAISLTFGAWTFSAVSLAEPVPPKYTISLEARPSIRQGDDLPLQLNVDEDRSSEYDFVELFDVTSCKLDGHPIVVEPAAELLAENLRHHGCVFLSSEHGGFASGWPVPIDSAVTRPLRTGLHRITAAMMLYRFNRSAIQNDDDGNLAFVRPRIAATTQPLLVDTTEVSTQFTVYDIGHEPPNTIDDPKYEDAIRKAIKVPPLKRGPITTSFAIEIREPSVRVHFDAYVRPAGANTDLITVSDIDCGTDGQSFPTAMFNAFPSDVQHVDVVLRPNVITARKQIDASPIWRKEVVIRDVPVLTEKP